MKRDERPTFSSRKMPKDHYRCLTVRFSPTFDESPSVIITERKEDKDVVDSCQRFLHWEILLSGKTFQTKQIRADTSHEVSALLVIFVFAKLKHNHEQR